MPDGGAVWFPAAFDEYGQRTIRAHVPELIDVEEEEAKTFCCNAVVLGRDIVRERLRHALEVLGGVTASEQKEWKNLQPPGSDDEAY